jgi:hypothetical protein
VGCPFLTKNDKSEAKNEGCFGAQIELLTLVVQSELVKIEVCK